jgi:hypothetical protein
VARERQSGGGRYTEPYEIGSIEGEARDADGGKVKLVTREEFQDAIGQSAYEPEV